MKYEQVWNAVDKLAAKNGLSPSGLAKKAGLDSTTFNKSKRLRPDGNKRWPSLDSINKLLEVCNISFEDFYNLSKFDGEEKELQNTIPYIKYSKLCDGANMLENAGWSKIHFPDSADNLYAVDIDVNDFEPYYRRGSVVIISKNSEIRRGDRIVVFLTSGAVLINEFVKRTAKTIELTGIADTEFEETVKIDEIKLINRIVWASQ